MATEFTDVPVPLECRKTIRAGALVAINLSGGKDSQAMTVLLSRIVPREQLLVVHAPLGEVEWPGIEHIEATLPDGVPLIFAQVSSGKSLLDRVEDRGKFPESGRDGVPPNPGPTRAEVRPSAGRRPVLRMDPCPPLSSRRSTAR